MLGNSRPLIGQYLALALEQGSPSPVETDTSLGPPGANCLFRKVQWGPPGEGRRRWGGSAPLLA